MNPNWTRWIHASLVLHFKEIIETKGNLKLYVEGQDRPEGFTDTEDRVEFRWDGPYAREVSRGYWVIELEINLLMISSTGKDDTHKHKKFVGLVQTAFTNTINVMRRGDGVDDNNTLLGCLQLRTDDQEAITTSYFGKIETDVSIEQTAVEGHYKMNLSA